VPSGATEALIQLPLHSAVPSRFAPRPGAIPQAQTNNATERPKAGLSVTWMQYGGPAKVTFDSTGPIAVTNGQAVTAAHFTAPGAYVLTATASDGALRTSAQVTITVK